MYEVLNIKTIVTNCKQVYTFAYIKKDDCKLQAKHFNQYCLHKQKILLLQVMKSTSPVRIHHPRHQFAKMERWWAAIQRK